MLFGQDINLLFAGNDNLGHRLSLLHYEIAPITWLSLKFWASSGVHLVAISGIHLVI